MEHRQAANFSGYTWEHFLTLPGDPWYAEPGEDCKADVIMYYRLARQMESIEQSIR